MAEPLRVLFVEDSGDDAELEMIQLRQAGFDVIHERVCSGPDLKAVIDGPWQVIIADYNMPNFTGLEALSIWKERRPEIPFILVSGSLGEDRAVEALKSGAHDYLMKDNLRRLGPAVVRALRESAAQRARARANAFESLLARASALLGESLDYELTLKRVAALAVPEFADWCVVDVLDERGALQPLATAHAEPEKLRVVEAISRRYPSRAETGVGPAAVVRTGAPQLIATFTPEKLAELAPETEQRVLLDQLAMRSYICVPLRARGAALGALTLGSSRPDRAYDGVDLAFAEELARRAAFAVDNARMYARTQDAVRLRDDFLSVASHELRTPLTTLQLQLQSLLQAVEKGQRPTTPKDEAKLRRAVRSTERLSDLVDTLVDVSRIASGSLPISRVPVDLNQAAHKVVQRYSDEAQRVGSTLVLKETAQITGQWDRERVEQMLGNLLSNALKYGNGQPIEIALVRGDGWAEMTVRDRGMGIAPADLERIFGRFERAVSVRNYGGLGLGLYITRAIVESHGGSVRADSRPGEGAAFTIRLPLQPPPPPRDPPPIP